MPLDRETAVAIIVTDNGHVENRLFNVPKGFTASDIEKMVNILNERLVGTPLIHLQKTLVQETKMILESILIERENCSPRFKKQLQLHQKNVCILVEK